MTTRPRGRASCAWSTTSVGDGVTNATPDPGVLLMAAPRRQHVALDVQQLLDRALGVRVAALAVVVVEQHPVAVEQVARRPAGRLVHPPDGERGVQADGVPDAEALARGAHGARVR